MRNVERTERTRGALVGAARRLFATQGYEATTTTAVVHAAGVTRGALYHHFADKRDLFRAVLEAVQEDLDARVGQAAVKAHLAGGDALEVFAAGVDELLAASADRDIARIVLIEGPMVLGAAEWHAIDDSFNERTLTKGVQRLIDKGFLEDQPSHPLVRLLAGMLNEAARTVANAADRDAARAEMSRAVRWLLATVCRTPDRV